MADDDIGLYTNAQMRKADAGAIASGMPGITLMEHAGAAIAERITHGFKPGKTLILAGPGNNGGDGFVAATCLAKAGWSVEVALLGDPGGLKGDAAVAFGSWRGKTVKLSPSVLDGADLVVDALFGAGLTRPIEGEAAEVIAALSGIEVPIIAVDMPSGVDGDSGEILGFAPKAAFTVTFHRAKPGHYLMPGRSHVGRLVIADIGIPDEVDKSLDIVTFLNRPALWQGVMPSRHTESHKYRHGHALVLGGGMASSGAARLAAHAALRAGAGLVTVLCPASALPVYAASLSAVMVHPFSEQPSTFIGQLADQRRNVILLGPGAGVGASLASKVEASLEADKAVVLDADALTSFADDPSVLFRSIKANQKVLLTPHEGEFKRIFDLKGDKLSRARRAAEISGATVLLKGPDTVIAAPDGRASILADAPPTLATAGSGDVLAGIALGLIAQSMPIFEAASAAAWLHGEAARTFGPGLIADDLADQLPEVFSKLFGRVG